MQTSRIRSFKGVPKTFRVVSRKIEGCFEGVFRVFQGYFKAVLRVLRVFQGGFKGV